MVVHWWTELTCLSNLPGLVKAGSRISGKFVAAINIMPYKKCHTYSGMYKATHQYRNLFICTSFCSKPSISTSSWCNVFFVWPSHCFLVDPTASISSMKIIQGAYERRNKAYDTIRSIYWSKKHISASQCRNLSI